MSRDTPGKTGFGKRRHGSKPPPPPSAAASATASAGGGKLRPAHLGSLIFLAVGFGLLFIAFFALAIEKDDTVEVSGKISEIYKSYYYTQYMGLLHGKINYIRFKTSGEWYEYTDAGPSFDRVVSAIQPGRTVTIQAWPGGKWIKWRSDRKRGKYTIVRASKTPIVALRLGDQPILSFEDFRANAAYWNKIIAAVGLLFFVLTVIWWRFSSTATLKRNAAENPGKISSTYVLGAVVIVGAISLAMLHKPIVY